VSCWRFLSMPETPVGRWSWNYELSYVSMVNMLTPCETFPILNGCRICIFGNPKGASRYGDGAIGFYWENGGYCYVKDRDAPKIASNGECCEDRGWDGYLIEECDQSRAKSRPRGNTIMDSCQGHVGFKVALDSQLPCEKYKCGTVDLLHLWEPVSYSRICSIPSQMIELWWCSKRKLLFDVPRGM
jgi:hypothetical protein